VDINDLPLRKVLEAPETLRSPRDGSTNHSTRTRMRW
jgi:hypothetical protein